MMLKNQLKILSEWNLYFSVILCPSSLSSLGTGAIVVSHGKKKKQWEKPFNTSKPSES